MRGKVIDMDFVLSFIQECGKLNKTSSKEICEAAIAKVSAIDEQIKLRIKLSDVLSHFDYKKKNNISKEIDISYSNINKDYAGLTLSRINEGELLVKDLMNHIIKLSNGNDLYKKDFIFTVKRLFETKVLSRSEEGIVSKGSNFDTFLKASELQ
jgi:hypothetical protein